MYCDKGRDLTLIHLYRLTGIVRSSCHNDRWLHGTPVNLLLPDRLRTALEISLTSAGGPPVLFIIHVGEHLCKYHRSLPPILCIHFFVLNHAVNGILIIVILEHHLDDLEMAALTSPTSCSASRITAPAASSYVP